MRVRNLVFFMFKFDWGSVMYNSCILSLVFAYILFRWLVFCLFCFCISSVDKFSYNACCCVVFGFYFVVVLCFGVQFVRLCVLSCMFRAGRSMSPLGGNQIDGSQPALFQSTRPTGECEKRFVETDSILLSNILRREVL